MIRPSQLTADPFQQDVLREVARSFGASYEHVADVFRREKLRLAIGARLTQYLDILALRRTRDVLHDEAPFFDDLA